MITVGLISRLFPRFFPLFYFFFGATVSGHWVVYRENCQFAPVWSIKVSLMSFRGKVVVQSTEGVASATARNQGQNYNHKSGPSLCFFFFLHRKMSQFIAVSETCQHFSYSSLAIDILYRIFIGIICQALFGESITLFDDELPYW